LQGTQNMVLFLLFIIVLKRYNLTVLTPYLL
jgi:hypothetical protein